MSNVYARYVPTKRNTAAPASVIAAIRQPQKTYEPVPVPAAPQWSAPQEQWSTPAEPQPFVHPSRANTIIEPTYQERASAPAKRKLPGAWEAQEQSDARNSKKSKKGPVSKGKGKAPPKPAAPVEVPVYESAEAKRAAKIARRAAQRAAEQGLPPPADYVPPKTSAAPEKEKPVVEEKPKEKKPPKREKKKKTPALTEAEQWVEDEKHKALLMKRERSMKKMERLAKREKEFALDNEGDAEMKDADPVAAVLEEPTEFHSLEPLPQPEPKPEAAPISIYSALPSWLGEPIRVAPTATSSFEDLGLTEDIIKPLAKAGFQNAFAVQAAVLPLLLPGTSHDQGDVLVSAATGSGKTLSYVLPMVDDISMTTVTQLRGLIVMPTRELVSQAREVFDICASAYGTGERKHVSVGVAIGNQTLKQEQAALMKQEYVYNPEEYQARKDRVNAMWSTNAAELPGNPHLMEETDDSAPLGHLIKYRPKVDVLICTPGRLVEHLKVTPGFTLEHLKWLVIDEADKLLDQSFQQWLETVMGALQLQEKNQSGPPRDRKYITKVVLSATMTRDVGLLTDLKLHKPKFVVLEGSEEDAEAGQKRMESLNLPDTLHESAVKVDDEGLKPLYLMEILKMNKLIKVTKRSALDSDSDSSESESESESSDSSDSDSSDSDSSDSSSSATSVSSSEAKKSKSKSKKKVIAQQPAKPLRGTLIFTRSNESAIRLSRLLSLLSPKNASQIGTITSTTSRKRTLRGFRTGRLSVLVASDLVARGLDLEGLKVVINYDMPTSLTSYVHRVGRTARANREGSAVTLFTGSEGRWFWNDIARSGVQRKSSVERVTISKDKFREADKRRYEKTLERLGKEASGIDRFDKKDAKK